MKHIIPICCMILILCGCNVFSAAQNERILPERLEFRESSLGEQVGLVETTMLDGRTVYLGSTSVSGDDIARIRMDVTETALDFEVQLTDSGAAKMEELTSQRVGQTIAILVDGEVIIAPTINTPITDRGLFHIYSGSVTPRLIEMLDLSPAEVERLEQGL